MPIIREYTSQVGATGQIRSRGASAADFGVDGIAKVGAAIGVMGDAIQRREEESEISDIRARMAQANADWTENYIERQQNAQPGDMTFAETLKKDMGEYLRQMRDTVRTRKGQELFNQLAANMAGNFVESALKHQAALAGAKAKQDFTVALEANQRTVAKDPGQYEFLLSATERTLDDPEGPFARLAPLMRDELRVKSREALAAAAVDGWIEGGGARDFLEAARPQANAVRANGVPIGGVPGGSHFNAAVEAVLAKEGGYNAKDGNSDAPVNFGINQRANPDIDVKNLTRGKAIELYRDRYWSKIDGDNLPPRVAMFAFDAAVNMGVDAAKKLIKETGGDLDQMVAMRKVMYQDIVARNPAQGKYLNGWISRTDRVAKEAAGLPMEQPVAVNLPEATPESKPLAVGDAAFDALPYAVQLQKIRLAETRVNQEMAVYQARVRATVQDQQAEAMATGNVGTPLQQRDFVSAYGEAQGLDLWASYRKNVIELGADVQRVRGMSFAEQNDLLARYASQVQGEGAAQAASRLESVERAVRAQRSAFEKDPAAYVIHLSPDIRGKFDALAQALADGNMPQAQKAEITQAYATAAMAEQKRLGNDQPVLLPAAHADKIVAQFHDQQQGGQNAAVLMHALAEQWGAYWPQVYGQMAPKLPSAAVVIGAGMKPAPAALLAEAAALGRGEMLKTMPPNTAGDVAEALSREMAAFESTMAPQHGGLQTANRVREGTELLALRYMRSGMNASDAARQAFTDTVGEKYNFRGTFRVPVEHDAVLVERGAQQALQNLESFGLDVPPSAFALDEADARATYIRSLKAYSKWVTAADESGLVLYNQFGAAVMGADGEPVKLTWGELSERGKTVPVRRELRHPAKEMIRRGALP